MKKPSAKAIARQKRSANSRVRRSQPSPLSRWMRPTGALLVGSLAGGHALAATIDIDYGPSINDLEVTVTGHEVIGSPQVNAANVSASILNSIGSIDTDVGTGTALSLDVTDNVFGALAAGNSFVNEIDLGLIDDGGAAANAAARGAAALGFSLNFDATISSSVTGSGFSDANIGVTTGSFTVSDNLATAQTTVNAGDTRFSGIIPIGFVDATLPADPGSPGEINLTSFASPSLELDTVGTISAATVQIQQQDAPVSQSSAALDGNFATLSLFPADAAAEDVSGALAVDSNEFSAIFRGNLATTGVTLETGGAPTFEGTVSLATVQLNELIAGPVVDANASVTNTVVSSTVGDPAGIEFSTLIGSLTVSDNVIRGAATGSEAATALTIDSGLSFLGRESTGPLGTTLGLDSGEVDADLGILSAQYANTLPFLTELDLNRVSADVQSLRSGTVTLDGNQVRGTATGNQSGADLTVAGSNTFVGSAAIGNIQHLETGSGAVASVDGTVVEVTVASGSDSQLADATVSVTGTEIGASATGNRTTAALDFTGNSIDLGARQDGARRAGLETDNSGASVVTEVRSGATVASVQVVEDGVVNAGVDDATIRILAAPVAITGHITESSLDLTGSIIESVAMAGSAGQSIAISANDVVGSAGVSNFQSFSGAVAATTTDFSLNITAGFGAAAPGVNVDDSSLTLENNLVRGLAFGNMADSAILIDASTATAPALEPAGPFLAGLISEIGYAGGVVNLQQSQAAYAINSFQEIDGSVSSTVSSGNATVQTNNALRSSTATNDANVIVGAAFGNDALNAIDLDVGNLSLTAAEGAVASLSNIQSVPAGAGVSTTISDVGFLGRVVGFVQSSTGSVDGNVIQAQVAGNRAAANGGLGNTLTVTGGNVLVDSTAAYTGLESNLDLEALSADTPFALQNLQLFNGDDVAAGVTGASAQFQVVGSVIGSTLSVDGNQFLAGGTVNQATNRVAFDDITTLEGAAGLQSLQSSTGGASSATFTGATIALNVNQSAGNVTDSTLSLNDNFIQASARNNVVGNRVDVEASNLEVPGNDAVGSTLDFGNDVLNVNAAFGLSSQQFATDETTAEITGLGLTTTVGGDLIDSTSLADGNVASAAATANTASSVLNIASGNLSVADANHGPVGAVANVQVLSDDVTASIDTSGSGSLILLTDITGDITRSTVSASDNTFQAIAAGNRAFESDGNGGVVGNALNVNGGSISTPPTRPLAGLAMDFGGDLLSADLAFTVQSAQISSANLIADQTQTGVRINRDGIVDSSTVMGDANTFSSSAINNQAANAATLLDLNSLESTAGVQNFQHVIGTSGTTTSTLGNEFEQGSPGGLFPTNIIDLSIGATSTFVGGVLTAGGGDIVLDISAVFGDPEEALLLSELADLGFVVDNGAQTATILDGQQSGVLSGVFTAGVFQSGIGGFLESVQVDEYAIDPTPDVPASPFVIASLNGTILDSTISVIDNRFSSVAMANDAISRLAVDANAITEAADLVDAAEARINFGVFIDDLAVSADFGVSNLQRLDPDAEVAATGYGTVGIETAAAPASSDVERSSLLVNDNVLDVRGQGNRAINVLELSATNLGSAGVGDGAASALLSVQVGLSDVEATGGLLGFATGAIEDSTLEIRDNRSRANAVLNDATNRVDLSGSNLHSSTAAAVNAVASVDASDAAVVAADAALNNLQVGGPVAVNATAESLLRNFDALHANTQGIEASSALLTGNLTEANAVSNRSGNLLNIDASNLSVSGGVLNAQESQAAVTASATSTVQFALINTDGAVVTDSTIAVSGNSTVATASGNRGSSALNGFASAGYTGISGAGATGSVNVGTEIYSAAATFGVLNTQSNEGAITAGIADASYEIGLTGTAAAVTGSTLQASGNQMIAEASANFARNDIGMSVRPTGNGSAALTSLQTNTGGVLASLSNSRTAINVTGGAGVTGNTASVAGNRGIARASGNTAVNRILSGD